MEKKETILSLKQLNVITSTSYKEKSLKTAHDRLVLQPSLVVCIVFTWLYIYCKSQLLSYEIRQLSHKIKGMKFQFTIPVSRMSSKSRNVVVTTLSV